MIERDRRDRGRSGMVHDIRRIEPAAQSGFEQHEISRGAGKGEKCRRGGDLEIGDRPILIRALAFFKQVDQLGFVDQPAGEPDPLVKPDEMRRRVGVNLASPGFQAGSKCRDRRTLAISAGYMDHRRQLVLRVAQRFQQRLDAPKG